MKHSSLESSHWDESNGGCFILLQSLDQEIFNEMLTCRHLKIYNTVPHAVSSNISWSSDRRKMKHSSLESPHRDESNSSRFVFLWSLDHEIFDETACGAVSKCRIVSISLNISWSSNCKRMKQPPFDSSQRDDFNELFCNFLQSLDYEIFNKM